MHTTRSAVKTNIFAFFQQKMSLRVGLHTPMRTMADSRPRGEFKNRVKQQVVRVFRSNGETLGRILEHLDANSNAHYDQDLWNSLQLLLQDEQAFKVYLQRLDRRLYNPKSIFIIGLQLTSGGLAAIASVWRMVPPETQNELASSLFGFVSKWAAPLWMTGYLTLELCYSIYLWDTGEILGSQCADRILDAVVAVGGGVAGGIYLGTCVSCPPALLTAIFGAGCSNAARCSLEYLIRTVFSKSKEEILQMAYEHVDNKCKRITDFHASRNERCFTSHAGGLIMLIIGG